MTPPTPHWFQAPIATVYDAQEVGRPQPRRGHSLSRPRWCATAANQPRAQASITDRPVRHRLVWGASTLLAFLALATVVSGLN
jgi:hypothetical protein